QVFRMLPAPEGSRVAYRPRGIPQGRFWDSNQLPCQKPPWGTLTSVDLKTGKLRWQVPLGIVEALEKRGIPPTGAPNLGGSIVTAGGPGFICAADARRLPAVDEKATQE